MSWFPSSIKVSFGSGKVDIFSQQSWSSFAKSEAAKPSLPKFSEWNVVAQKKYQTIVTMSPTLKQKPLSSPHAIFPHDFSGGVLSPVLGREHKTHSNCKEQDLHQKIWQNNSRITGWNVPAFPDHISSATKILGWRYARCHQSFRGHRVPSNLDMGIDGMMFLAKHLTFSLGFETQNSTELLKASSFEKKTNATTWPVELFQRLLWNTAMMQWGCRMLKSFNFSWIMSSPNIQPTTNSNHKSHLGILIHMFSLVHQIQSFSTGITLTWSVQVTWAPSLSATSRFCAQLNQLLCTYRERVRKI